MKIINKQQFIYLLEWAMVLYVSIYMSFYGIGKIVQFDNTKAYTKPLSDYTGMQLMWAFYGYSKSYALILGFFEILGSLLLVVKKTRLIGCFVLSTILFNIILQDSFYGVIYGALANAITYQVFIFIILYINRIQLIKMIKSSFIISNFSFRNNWVRNIFIILILLFSFYLIQFLINFILNSINS